jgi:hypothetical protein
MPIARGANRVQEASRPGRSGSLQHVDGRKEATIMAAGIPLASNGSWVLCNEVEQFLLDRQGDESEPTLEELGQLSRLLSDLRLDSQHLTSIADDVEELLEARLCELRDLEQRDHPW